MTINTRDISVDALRSIAIVSIILVHSGPNLFLEQLRNFDVPLMVFLSGLCLKNKSNPLDGYLSYLRKRFVRLVLPSWIFMLVYFSIDYIMGGVKSHDVDFVVSCFTLQTGWYFWIVRVLFIIAAITPILQLISNNTSAKKVVIASAIVIVSMDVLCRLSNNNYYIMLITILPYSAIFALGYNIRRISSKSILAITLVSTFIYISIAIILFYLKGVYMPTGVHKYPPRTYYICYALACIGFLFLNRYRIVSILDSLKVLKLSSFIGSHSFWIYLWHIPFVDSFVNMGLKWYITFPMTLLAAILCTYIQTCIVEVVSKGVTEKKAKFIRLIFEG